MGRRFLLLKRDQTSRAVSGQALLASILALVGERVSPDAGGRALLAVSGRGSHAAVVASCAQRVVGPRSPFVDEPCSPRVVEPCSL
eukprot:1077785-Pleurochrysis_carterae.AAC.1